MVTELRGRPILLITRMITDRIGLHSVLLPLLIMCLIFNFYIPILTSVEEVDEEDEGRPEMPLERESFPEYEGKQRK